MGASGFGGGGDPSAAAVPSISGGAIATHTVIPNKTAGFRKFPIPAKVEKPMDKP